MAGQKISDMPIKATLDEADLVPIVSSVPTGQDANYRFNLFDLFSTYPTSATLAESTGSTLVGWIKAATGAVLRTLSARANDTVSTFDFIPVAQQAAIIAGTSTYDCTADLTAAITHVKATGQTLRFVGGRYYVSTLTLDGSNYAIDTSAGVTFKQVPGVVADVLGPPGVVRLVSATNVSIGSFNVLGNIATDTGEFNHGLLVSQCKNVQIGSVFGTNIRGDVAYCYSRNTSTPERQSGIEIASVSGTNVYRNLLSVVGGQVRVGAVINAGPVGYRDFDVEPNNSSGSYEAVDLEIGYAKVGSAEITSDDAAIINHAVRIGIFDADLSRVQATTPAYPSAPGASAYALGVARTDTVQIGHFRARNYNVYPLTVSMAWSHVHIGTFDVANCSLTDTTFDTMILQQGNAQGGKITIDNLICDAANTKYLARVQGTGLLAIEVRNIRTMKCLIGVQISGRFAQGTINLNSAAGIALQSSSGVTFDNVTTSNGGSATGFYQSTNIVITNSTLTFGTLDGGGTGSSNIVAINSAVNGSTVDGVNMVLTGAIRVAGTKVVGAQQTGWTTSTGTASKGAYATYAGQALTGSYVQATMQATDDAAKAASQRVKALEDAMRAHGLIN